MLNLKSSTAERWLAQVDDDLPSLLIDHAHCEKKAADTAMSFIIAGIVGQWSKAAKPRAILAPGCPSSFRSPANDYRNLEPAQKPNRAAVMRALVLAAAFLLAAQPHAIAADPATAWRGVKVFPRLGALVKVGGQLIAENEFSDAPWIVQDVKGDLLWVGDELKGWVERCQVVTLAEAPSYFTGLIYLAGLINDRKRKAWAYRSRGIASQHTGDIDSAIADYEEELRLESSTAAYNNRGVAWDSKKEYDKAIADYNEAARLDPKNAVPYKNRGDTWRKKGDYDRALADYDKAIHLAPKSADAFNGAAWLRATCVDERYRNGNKAVGLATNACEVSGWDNFNWIDTLAAAHAEAGDFDSAIKYQNKAIELNPTDAEFLKGANERLTLYKNHKPYREE